LLIFVRNGSKAKVAWASANDGSYLEARHRLAQHAPVEMTQTVFFAARNIASPGPIFDG
jgi:hypothetical protein